MGKGADLKSKVSSRRTETNNMMSSLMQQIKSMQEWKGEAADSFKELYIRRERYIKEVLKDMQAIESQLSQLDTEIQRAENEKRRKLAQKRGDT